MFLIFSAERECYFASDKGYSYIGTQNVSISGKPCLNWLDIDAARYGITHRNAGNFEGNQCRVSDEEHYGSIPECFVGNEEVEKCPVPACGNWIFSSLHVNTIDLSLKSFRFGIISYPNYFKPRLFHNILIISRMFF